MKRLLATTAVATLAVTGLGVGTASADTATPAPTTTEATMCSTGRLPAVVQGKLPSLKPGSLGGDYLWHDGKGWHLSVTHIGHAKAVFTGTIKASRPISYVKVRDERNDVVKLSADKRTLTFRFVNYAYLDGLDFRVDCAKWVGFSLQADGHRLTPRRVFLGAKGVHPTSNPFVIERR